MADYNIYIHAISGGGNQYNPTVPWSKRESNEGGSFTQTQSQSGFNIGSIPGVITKLSSIAQNPDSVLASAASSALKVLPWVAAAYACVNLGIKAYDTALEFGTLQSGDHIREVTFSNIRQGINNIHHPVSSTIQSLKTQIQWSIENQKRTQERDLLGDSVINQYTGRGV